MKRIIIIAVALYSASLFAGPAAWYRWQGPEGGIAICSQISPGDGWVVVKGPFQDGLCKALGKPG